MNNHDDNGDHKGFGSGFDGGFSGGFDNGFGTGSTEGLQLPPWERRERFGLLNALYLTVKDVLLAPQRFYHQMPSRVGLMQPLLFAIVLGVISSFFLWMWSLVGSSLEGLLSTSHGDLFKGPVTMFVLFVVSPLTVILLVFLRAALFHLVLMLVGGDRLGFEATFRVAAYGEAASLLAVVPACGLALGIIWSMAISVVGLYAIHETDPWRAIVSVLVPMLLCLSVMGGSVLLVLMGLG